MAAVGDRVLRRTAARRAIALRWPDVDLGASTIRVEGSWTQYEGAIEPKSRLEPRTVPLLAILRDYLDELSSADGASERR